MLRRKQHPPYVHGWQFATPAVRQNHLLGLTAPAVKLKALESVIPPKLRTVRFHAADQLTAMLNATLVMRSERRSI